MVAVVTLPQLLDVVCSAVVVIVVAWWSCRCNECSVVAVAVAVSVVGVAWCN